MSNTTAFDVKRAWAQTKRALGAMTSEQRKKTLIKSGILTEKGNVTKPYAKVIK